MHNHTTEARNGWRNLIVTTAGIVAFAVTVFLSLMIPPRLRAQAPTAPPPAPQLPTMPQWQTTAGGKMAFDVASVKPNKASEPLSGLTMNIVLGPGDFYVPDGGRFSETDVPLLIYIQFAYKMGLNQLRYLVPQLPKWVYTDRFDIEARAPISNPTKDQMRLMMQALLADRFSLALHAEARELPAYALVLSNPGNTGPQLQPDSSPCTSERQAAAPALPPGRPSAPSSASGLQLPSMFCGGIVAGLPPSTPGRVRSGAWIVSMGAIADWLDSWTAEVDRPVLDQTGLSGTFDFAFEFAHEFNGPLPPNFQQDPTAPTFTQALQEQLGLKLKPTTGPVDVLILDHVEEPSPN